MKPLIDPTDDEWRAYFLRNRGEFFDIEDAKEWHRKALLNTWICARDLEEYDITHEPTDEKRFQTRFSEYIPQPMKLKGRTHLALSLPREGVVDYTSLRELYLYTADMIEKYNIEKVITIVDGEFMNHDSRYYPYVILWFARPVS